MKSHYDEENSYKEKHLVGAGLQFQKSNLLSSCQESRQCEGRFSAGGLNQKGTEIPQW